MCVNLNVTACPVKHSVAVSTRTCSWLGQLFSYSRSWRTKPNASAFKLCPFYKKHLTCCVLQVYRKLSKLSAKPKLKGCPLLDAILRFVLLNRLLIVAVALFVMVYGTFMAGPFKINVFPNLTRLRVMPLTGLSVAMLLSMAITSACR